MDKVYCQCGCGQEVGTARSNDPRYGHIKGQPFKFRGGHQYGKRPETLEGILAICKEDENGCLNWTKSLDSKGYGQYIKNKTHTRVHRAVYEMVHGEIGSSKIVVLHTCDNPSCCNPDHLTLGTYLDNNRDAKAKGRAAIGSRHGMSKLSEEQAIEILSSNSQPNELARVYGVSAGQVNNIRSRKLWSHLPDTRTKEVKAKVEKSTKRLEKHAYKGRLISVRGIAKLEGIPAYSIRYWMKRGRGVETAVIEILRRKHEHLNGGLSTTCSRRTKS